MKGLRDDSGDPFEENAERGAHSRDGFASGDDTLKPTKPKKPDEIAPFTVPGVPSNVPDSGGRNNSP